MTKKYTIIILLLILALAGYLWWMYMGQTSPTAEQAATDIQKTVESINQNVAEHIFATTTANPLENVPDVNPYKDINPFSDIKTNPF